MVRRAALLAALFLCLARPSQADERLRVVSAFGDTTARTYAEALAALWTETVTGLAAETANAIGRDALFEMLAEGQCDAAVAEPLTEPEDHPGTETVSPVSLFVAYPTRTTAEDGTVVTAWVQVIVRPTMPEDEAFALTRAAFEGAARLRRAVPAVGAASVEETVVNLRGPLHPGAARYLAELGFPPPE